VCCSSLLYLRVHDRSSPFFSQLQPFRSDGGTVKAREATAKPLGLDRPAGRLEPSGGEKDTRDHVNAPGATV